MCQGEGDGWVGGSGRGERGIDYLQEYTQLWNDVMQLYARKVWVFAAKQTVFKPLLREGHGTGVMIRFSAINGLSTSGRFQFRKRRFLN